MDKLLGMHGSDIKDMYKAGVVGIAFPNGVQTIYREFSEKDSKSNPFITNEMVRDALAKFATERHLLTYVVFASELPDPHKPVGILIPVINGNFIEPESLSSDILKPGNLYGFQQIDLEDLVRDYNQSVVPVGLLK